MAGGKLQGDEGCGRKPAAANASHERLVLGAAFKKETRWFDRVFLLRRSSY